MGVHRFLVVAALLLGGGAGLGAGAAPEGPTLNLSGPDQVVIGQTAVFTVQAGGAADPLGVSVALTLPAGITYVSGAPGAVNTVDGGRNSGPCAVDGQVVTCSVDHPEDGLLSWTATVRVAADVVPGEPLSLVAASGEINRKLATVPVRGADFAVSVEDGPTGVLEAGKPITYTVVVRNLGPDAGVPFTLHEWFDGGWYIGGGVEQEGVECFSDPGEMACEVDRSLPAGGEIRLEHVLPTRADAGTVGRRGLIGLQVRDQPLPVDPGNNELTFPIQFAVAPTTPPASSPTSSPTASPTPSSSPSPTATATPAPGGAGGGLPITGPGAGPIALVGAVLLLAGVAALRFGRRRAPR
ncbi:hypothetical protein M1L60_31720 [Actinoplanes sp. TRM 88003]|uniref:DUF11 domain-containing protein n=1 Tax=Paractinoplanes aksuensis TaxID=2939490 RepID=A0ABT1DWC9_9ACTN|nr:hypothetical protein [Actinoplanes aksuensis]MCO8275159.1 hypothetical protein [Actinoplanes aksuensis]